MTFKPSILPMTVTYKAVSADGVKIAYRNSAFKTGPARVPAMQLNQPTQNKKLNTMKNMTKLKLSFTSLAFALPLVISGCNQNPPQTGSTMSDSTMATNQPQMGGTMANDTNNMSPPNNMAPSQSGNMGSDSMMTNQPETGNSMSGDTHSMSSPNNMTPSQSGNMGAGSAMTTNQPQMGNSMSGDTHSMSSSNNMAPSQSGDMAAPQSGNMESHP